VRIPRKLKTKAIKKIEDFLTQIDEEMRQSLALGLLLKRRRRRKTRKTKLRLKSEQKCIKVTIDQRLGQARCVETTNGLKRHRKLVREEDLPMRKRVQEKTGLLPSVKSVSLPGTVQHEPDYLRIRLRSVLLGRNTTPNFSQVA
jgi:hypothetical protein